MAPTVPIGKERIRVCLHAGNEVDEVDRLVASIGVWVTELSTLGDRETVGKDLGKLQIAKL